MSILLYLPGLLVVLFKRHGPFHTLRHVANIVLYQALIALPFLHTHPWSYLSSAFELSRVFLHKWTVNWRFVPEDVFLSRSWASTLLAGQLFTLIAFASVKWCRSDGGVMSILNRALRRPAVGASVKGVPSDGVFAFISDLLFVNYITFIDRIHYYLIHVKSGRDHLREVTPLSILQLVRTTSSLPSMAHKVSYHRQVVAMLMTFTY